MRLQLCAVFSMDELYFVICVLILAEECVGLIFLISVLNYTFSLTILFCSLLSSASSQHMLILLKGEWRCFGVDTRKRNISIFSNAFFRRRRDFQLPLREVCSFGKRTQSFALTLKCSRHVTRSILSSPSCVQV